MKIESLNNAKVKTWQKLKEKKYRDETNLFIIEGDHLIQEAKKKNIIKEIITIDSEEKADYYVNLQIMKKISCQKSISKSIAVCYKLKENKIKNRILGLDNIQDPGNLGTMIRSAVAFNFDTIVLSNNTVDLYNDKVIRASEGMIFHLNIIRCDLEKFLQENISEYDILITDVQKGENIKNISLSKKIILVIGNEGNGVNKEIKKYNKHLIKLNMNQSCESLNASIAASILMYEINEGSYE